MAIYRRFRVQQKYVNGQPTEEYRLGVEIDSTDYNSLEECNRGSDCTELEYRWVDMESADDYICEGTNKYKKQMKQQKCVTEEAWTNVYPYEYQKGDLIEHDSVDCGYVSGEYHIYGTTDGHGSINISPSKEYYSSTDVVTITALASTDYMFSCYNYGGNMTYGSVTYNSVLSLTMSHNWYVSAVFKSAQYKVYDLTTVGGSLTISPSKEYYSPTDIVTITATPNTNYSFSNYSYGSTSEYGQNSTNSILTLTMSNDWYVKGNFVYDAASGGSLYYSYNDGTESWYNWSMSTLSKSDNNGKYASIIIDYGGIVLSLPSSAFYSQSYLTSIDLPKCTYIGEEAFSYCKRLQSVNLSNCSYVGEGAFYSCSWLKSVNLSKCITIDSSAFQYCSALPSISLPNCLYIGSAAFFCCWELPYIGLPNCSYVGSFAFGFCSKIKSISLPNCSYVGGSAFSNCESLASIDLPNCTSVGEYGFYGCSSLSSINLPSCLYIGNSTFNYCWLLTSIKLPKVAYIGSYVFGFTSIETLYMDQITSVPSGGDPFAGGSAKLKSIFIPCSLLDSFVSHSIWSKYSSYFVCTGEGDLKEIFTATDGGGVITLDPEGGKYYSGTTVNIGYSANPGYVFSYFQYGSTPAYGSTVLNESFSLVMNQNWYVSINFNKQGSLYYLYNNGTESWYDWSKSTLSKSDNTGSLASIIIDYGGIVLSLSSRAFYSQSYLTSIDLPKCTYIGSEAFYSCYSLTNVNLPNCSYVSEDAFHDCWELASIYLPNCSYVGRVAFNNCSSLSTIDLPKCISIDSVAFGGCRSLISVNAPNCTYINSYAFNGCHSLISVNLPNCSYVGGVAFNNCSALQSIDLPLCTYVGGATFESCISLTSVNLPLCAYVGNATFEYCYSLSSINLPLCSYIGSSAFKDCSVLITVSIPKCSYAGSYAFYYCKSLQSIDLPLCSYVGIDAFGKCVSLTNVNLPNCLSIGNGTFGECEALISVNLLNCSSVEYKAFFYCIALLSIDLPNCLYVDSGVFYYCPKLSIVHLPKVTYIGSSAFYSAPIETLYMDQITSVPSGGDPYIESSYIKSIFIPCSLLNDFTSHSIWSRYRSYFVCV